MAGGFLLTDRNASIQELFIEDRHLVLFSSKQEMLEKINYYRIHPDKRDEIAMNGKKEVLANHSCLSRMRKILDTVLPII
jgi:spore maturation protein CgeB